MIRRDAVLGFVLGLLGALVLAQLAAIALDLVHLTDPWLRDGMVLQVSGACFAASAAVFPIVVRRATQPKVCVSTTIAGALLGVLIYLGVQMSLTGDRQWPVLIISLIQVACVWSAVFVAPSSSSDWSPARVTRSKTQPVYRWTILIAIFVVSLFVIVDILPSMLGVGTKMEPLQIYTPRFAADQRGVFYIQEYQIGGEDDFAFRVRYRASVGSKAIAVSADATGIPRAVASGHVDSITEPALSDSPNGRTQLETNSDSGRFDSPTLIACDYGTTTCRVITKWDSGLVEAAEWLDDTFVLVGIGACSDDSARIELVDVGTGSSETLLRVPATGYSSVAHVGRIVIGPGRSALFAVSATELSTNLRLYRYDMSTQGMSTVGTVSDAQAWDYSPQRNVVVATTEGAPDGLVEWVLPPADSR